MMLPLLMPIRCRRHRRHIFAFSDSVIDTPLIAAPLLPRIFTITSSD